MVTKFQNRKSLLGKLGSVAGVAAATTLIGLPVLAAGVLNPHPSIFQEAPYNRGGSTGTMSAQPSGGSTMSPSMSSPSEGTTSETESKTVADIVETGDSFHTLKSALQAAGLLDTLEGQGPFTVFAPTDAAFAALPKATLQKLVQPANKQQLIKVLTYHVVAGKVTSGDLKSGNVATAEGSNLKVKVGNRGVMVNNAKVTQADVVASNGVVHVIDKVLLPPDLK